MNAPVGAEWQFHGIKEECLWAACIWEYCREYVRDVPGKDWPFLRRKQRLARDDRMSTIGRACSFDEFPGTPWLSLGDETRLRLVHWWKCAPGELEDYEPLERIQREARGNLSEAQWKESLQKEGCVLFDLGLGPRSKPDLPPDWSRHLKCYGEVGAKRSYRLAVRLWEENQARKYGADWRKTKEQQEAWINEGRPTRAQLLRRFGDWLDLNPDWWDGKGVAGRRYGVAGKKDPRDGLRWLAWARLKPHFIDDQHGVEYVDKIPEAKTWLGVRGMTAARLREIPRESSDWLQFICQAK